MDRVVAVRGGGVGEQGGEAPAVEILRCGQAGECGECGIDVHGFDERGGGGAFLAGDGDEERDARGLLVVGMLTPHAVVAEVPAVIAPENDDRVFRETGFVKRGHDLAELGVHVTRRGIVAVDEAASEFVVEWVVAGRDAVVVAKFTAELRRVVGSAFGSGQAGGLREFGGIVEIPVFFRRDEGEVGFEETDAHEERFARGGGGFEASDGFGGDLAVGVEIVGDVGGFDGGAVGFFGGFAGGFFLRSGLGGRGIFGEGVLRGLRAEMRDGPRGDIFEVAVADVEELAHRCGVVTGGAEILRQRDGVGARGAEVGGKIVDTERLRAKAREEGVARGRADCLIAVSAVEAQRARGETVNVRGFRQRVAVGAEDGFEVVDADEEDVGAGGREERGGRERQGEEEEAGGVHFVSENCFLRFIPVTGRKAARQKYDVLAATRRSPVRVAIIHQASDGSVIGGSAVSEGDADCSFQNLRTLAASARVAAGVPARRFFRVCSAPLVRRSVVTSS